MRRPKVKLREPFLTKAAFSEGLPWASTVLIAFCTNYVLWLWSREYPHSTDEKAWGQRGY